MKDGVKSENRKALTGNQAGAWGAKLSKPDIVAAYPITPQTPLVEHLSEFIADGKMDAKFKACEGEHGTLSFLQGAALTGCRTFTGSSSHGLYWMFESYVRQALLRLPMVLCIVGRESGDITVWTGHQDAFTIREAGWIQLFCEDNQEILDSIICSYKVGEDEDVLLPVNVCYEGFYLSHFTQGVTIPEQERVDEFLPTFNGGPVKIDPDEPMSVTPMTPGELLTEYREKQVNAMKKAKDLFIEVDREFHEYFGRSYGGVIDTYRLADADYAIVTIGSATGTAREAIDKVRKRGEKPGLLKIRIAQPFPEKEVKKAISHVSAVGVIDRSVNFGSATGQIYQNVRSTLSENEGLPVKSYIGGLGGCDINMDKILKVIEDTSNLKTQEGSEAIIWLDL